MSSNLPKLMILQLIQKIQLYAYHGSLTSESDVPTIAEELRVAIQTIVATMACAARNIKGSTRHVEGRSAEMLTMSALHRRCCVRV